MGTIVFRDDMDGTPPTQTRIEDMPPGALTAMVKFGSVEAARELARRDRSREDTDGDGAAVA